MASAAGFQETTRKSFPDDAADRHAFELQLQASLAAPQCFFDALAIADISADFENGFGLAVFIALQ